MTTDSPKVTSSVVSTPRLEARLEQGPLQDIAQPPRRSARPSGRTTPRDVRDRDHADRHVAPDDGQVAVRQVDDLHDAEHQRQAAGEQRVEPAESARPG